MPFSRSLSLLLAFALLPFAAQAQSPRIVAVLPLVDVSAPAHRLDAPTKTLLEESIRTVAGDMLSPHGYTILTGENTLTVLSDNGVDATKSCESNCSLAAARELKASLFISGSVALSEGQYVAIIRLFESERGRQISSAQLEGATVRDIRRSFSGKAPEFFGPLLLPAAALEPAPSVSHRAGLGTAIVGGAALIAAIALEVAAHVQANNLTQRSSLTPYENVQSKVNQANTEATSAAALFGVGGGAALGGVGLMVFFK